MGVTSNCAEFLFYTLRHNVNYEHSVMLGRQQLYATEKELKGIFPPANHDDIKLMLSGKYAESFFERLGAKQVDSLDFSEYEGASLIHDLNTPIPDRLKGKYTLLFDGGTLEHVFNFPVAIRNCMDLIKMGGHFISITPCNNHCGHGFYQFSPELFYSLFTKQHGFKIQMLYLAVELPDGKREWYEVADPNEVKSRVTLQNAFPSYLMVLAKKEFQYDQELNVFQSDYSEAWVTHSEQTDLPPSNFIVVLYRKLLPEWLRDFIYKIRHGSKGVKQLPGLGVVNSVYYKKISR